MSFAAYKDLIEENDTVIIYISFNTMYPVKVTPTKADRNGEMVENVLQTNYGALKVKDLVGKRFGTKVRFSRGYAYALYPTPELWTKCLPHRTQILYSTDIALVTTQLELRPGSVVVESGTGSGSLSHAIARTVSPGGHLHTFDFHQVRSDTAREEFESHGLGDCVTAACRDVCADGFGLEDAADAVFLDLPHPWDAVPHAKRALRKSVDTRICSFSPCVEQVQKACEALRKHGFNEISTVECLQRVFQVRKITMPVYDEKRVKKQPNPTNEDEREEEGCSPSKMRKLEEAEADAADGDKKVENSRLGDGNGGGDSEVKPEKSFVTGVPLLTMPGHTGYLTFATLPATLPKKVDISDQAVEESQ